MLNKQFYLSINGQQTPVTEEVYRDNKSQSKIYYRPLKMWLEVTGEEKSNWERFTDQHRKANQRAGACCIPYKKCYRCDALCDTCEYRCIPNDAPDTVSIDFEMELAANGKHSKKQFLGDEAMTAEIDLDLLFLNILLSELQEQDPLSYKILMLYTSGLSERECAEQLGMPRNTYVYRRDQLIKSLRNKF